eukprot:1853857-Amphidinium_carterae.1
MHSKCLIAIGRTKPKCLSCDDIKMKPEPREIDGEGPPPNSDDDGYVGGGWYEGKGRRSGEQEKKPTKEDLIFKIALRVLPKLKVVHGLNLWSTIAANTFRFYLDKVQTRHDVKTKMPPAEKVQFEQKYTYGMGQLPP